MKRQISVIKEYQDFIFPGVIMIGCIATIIVTLISACSKKTELHTRSSFIVPVSYHSEGCPYPPGCDAFVTVIVTNNFLPDDETVSVKTIGDKVAISTHRPELYETLSNIELTNTKVNFRTR